MKVVVDTNILVSALMSPDNACRAILRMALIEKIIPCASNALFAEYEDVLGRDNLFEGGPFDAEQRGEFLDGFASVCRWSEVHYLWRPNLKDKDDNYLVELAIAIGAPVIITQNLKDFRNGELITGIEGLHPYAFLNQWRDHNGDTDDPYARRKS